MKIGKKIQELEGGALGYIVQSQNQNFNFALSYSYVDFNSKASLFSWKKFKMTFSCAKMHFKISILLYKTKK